MLPHFVHEVRAKQALQPPGVPVALQNYASPAFLPLGARYRMSEDGVDREDCG